jgi:signal transduction histidine kinase/CheY-like chemotaxis protein
VAEADASLRSVLERGLRENGTVVDAVADGTAAITNFRSYQYDVALVDWAMPKANGIEVLRIFRQRGIRTPILMRVSIGASVRNSESRRSHAAKVATIATVIVMGCYVIAALVLNLAVVHRLTSQADVRLAERLSDVGKLSVTGHGTAALSAHSNQHDDDAPIFVWSVSPRGSLTALTTGAPSFLNKALSKGARTVDIGSTPFRVQSVTNGSETLVAGESIAQIDRVSSALMTPELIFGLALLVVMFVGSLIIGLRASTPLELVRRRQTEFSADASHELRTPLSVIEAEVDLALSRSRSPDEYRSVLGRVADEGRRLRRIVDDLLWLARVDDRGMEIARDARVDLTAIARTCTDRFQAVAATRGAELSFDNSAPGPLYVHAEPEWVDRLIGVLIDNACKYAENGGVALVRVHTVNNRIILQVDDNGPGIPTDQRTLIMDRFHRADEVRPGTGLGLAIADSVVRATDGTWLIADSPDGGARMQVSWRKSPTRRNSGSGAHNDNVTLSGRMRPASIHSRG